MRTMMRILCIIVCIVMVATIFTVGMPTNVSTGGQTTYPTGIVSYWKFDAGGGTTAYDSVGTNHGTLVNGPAWTTEGQVNGALSFDGVDDYVKKLSASGLPQGNEAFTVETWVYSTNPNHQSSGYDSIGHVVSFGTQSVNNWNLLQFMLHFLEEIERDELHDLDHTLVTDTVDDLPRDQMHEHGVIRDEIRGRFSLSLSISLRCSLRCSGADSSGQPCQFRRRALGSGDTRIRNQNIVSYDRAAQQLTKNENKNKNSSIIRDFARHFLPPQLGVPVRVANRNPLIKTRMAYKPRRFLLFDL